VYRYTPIKHDLIEKLPQVREYLSGCTFVVAAYLFGSYRRGEESALSDIDIAMLFDAGAALDAIRKWESTIFFELVQILRTDEIDLVVMNHAPLSLQFEIIFSGELLCNNANDIRTDYEVRTCSMYWDFKRLEDEYNRFSLRRLREKYGVSSSPFAGAHAAQEIRAC